MNAGTGLFCPICKSELQENVCLVCHRTFYPIKEEQAQTKESEGYDLETVSDSGELLPFCYAMNPITAADFILIRMGKRIIWPSTSQRKDYNSRISAILNN